MYPQEKRRHAMEFVRIGLDLAKNVFEATGVGGDGSAVLRKTLRREAMMPFFSGLAPCLVGMEACSGAHFLGSGSVGSRA
jgi:transposase